METQTKAAEDKTLATPAPRRKKTRFFETYISKTIKQTSPANGMTSNAKQQLNSTLCHVAQRVSEMANRLTQIAKKKTLSHKQVANAVSVVMSGELARQCNAEGEKAVAKFTEHSDVKGNSRQEKAGIIFPPSVTEKFLRNFGYSKVMVTCSAPVFLACVLEYLSAELLDLSTKNATSNGRVRVTIRDMELAVQGDEELRQLFRNCNISFVGGGVVPSIHASLLVKKPRKKKKTVTNASTTTATGAKKPHRFRPGTVALREIRKYQKMSNVLTFAKFPFERFVRSVIHSQVEGVKISKEVFVILQYFIEQYVVSVLHDANLAAVHAGRVKLMSSDIRFVSTLRGLNVCFDRTFPEEEKGEEKEEVKGEAKKSTSTSTTAEDVEDDVEEDVEEDVEDEVEDEEESVPEPTPTTEKVEEKNVEDVVEEEEEPEAAPKRAGKSRKRKGGGAKGGRGARGGRKGRGGKRRN